MGTLAGISRRNSGSCRVNLDNGFIARFGSTDPDKVSRLDLLAGGQIKAVHSWEKRLKRYLSPDLLIIDDFGLTALNSLQAEDFYEIASVRHLKKSVILISYRPPQDWLALFPDAV